MAALQVEKKNKNMIVKCPLEPCNVRASWCAIYVALQLENVWFSALKGSPTCWQTWTALMVALHLKVMKWTGQDETGCCEYADRKNLPQSIILNKCPLRSFCVRENIMMCPLGCHSIGKFIIQYPIGLLYVQGNMNCTNGCPSFGKKLDAMPFRVLLFVRKHD